MSELKSLAELTEEEYLHLKFCFKLGVPMEHCWDKNEQWTNSSLTAIIFNISRDRIPALSVRIKPQCPSKT